jgi:hypothetical protein
MAKKENYKGLLILILAAVMVGGLVSCISVRQPRETGTANNGLADGTFEFVVKYYDDPQLYDCSSITKIEFINGSSESAPVLDTQTVSLNEGDITARYTVSGFTEKDSGDKLIFGVKFTFASIPTQFVWSSADGNKILIEFKPGMTGDEVVFHRGTW